MADGECEHASQPLDDQVLGRDKLQSMYTPLRLLDRSIHPMAL